MALNAQELSKLEADVASGRNPLAFIPLANGLRRERRLAEALDVCQKGLEKNPQSLAGRTLRARLLNDLGRYREALAEAERAESTLGAAMGLSVERVRALIQVDDLEAARTHLAELEKANLVAPEVQMLRGSLREREGQLATFTVRASAAAVPRLRSTPVDELAALLGDAISSMCKVHCCAACDLDSGKYGVQGRRMVLEKAEELFQDLVGSCHEMEGGMLKVVTLETRTALTVISLRGRRLIILSVDPAVNFGRFLHRMNLVLQQHAPVASSAGTVTEDESNA